MVNCTVRMFWTSLLFIKYLGEDNRFEKGVMKDIAVKLK